MKEIINFLKDFKKENVSVKSVDGEPVNIRSDKAQIIKPDKAEIAKGGIDLNSAQMNMQVKKEGQDFKFNFNGTEIDAVQITGATFTIHTMTPVTNLPQILGSNLEPADK